MLSPGAETALRMIGWTFLPDLGTRMLLRTYRHFQSSPPAFLGLRPRQPPPINTPGYALQQRISFSVIILAYLLYTSIQAYSQAPPNFYELLGVRPDVDEGTLKTAFRVFARHNHPDRVGTSGESRFIAARTAFDTLKSDRLRFAYDRFGPDVIGWSSECSSIADYLERGLMASCGFYIISAAAMILYAIFGQSGFGAFWRYNLFFTLVSLELLLILSPQHSIFVTLFPTRTPYQHIRFLHQVFISLSIAITRIGPAILPSFSGGITTLAEWERERTVLHDVVKRVTGIAARLDREISKMIHTELKAAHGDEIDSSSAPVGASEAPSSTPAPSADTTRTASFPSSSRSPVGQQTSSHREDTLSPLPAQASQPFPLRPVAPNSSMPAAALGGMELGDGVMRHLSKEVELLIVERNLKRHPMLARIWDEGVAAGRAAYQREREEKLLARTQSISQSELTAVDSQRLPEGHSTNGTKPGEKSLGSWKEGYIQRRARSEEHSPSPPSSLPPRLFQGSAPSLTNTPPPSRPLRKLSSNSSDVSKSDLHRRSSSTSLPNFSLPRPGSAFRRSVEAQQARMRDTALDRQASSPGPDLNLIGAAALANARSPGPRRVGSESFPGSPGYLGSPTPGEGQFDSIDSLSGPNAIRSRSMSLIG